MRSHPAARVYGEGISQNGRFLRDFLYQGFNADEDGKMALDGVLAHVAGAGPGQLQLSLRAAFARFAADVIGPFSDGHFPFYRSAESDPVTGEKGGLLDRAVADQHGAPDFLLQHFL